MQDFSREIFTQLNSKVIEYVKSILQEKTIKDVSVLDNVSARESLNVSVLTGLASSNDLDNLIISKGMNSEDYNSSIYLNDDGTYRIIATSYIYIDSGNNSSTQKSLSENSWLHCLLWVAINKTLKQAGIYNLFQISEFVPTNHPFSANNTISSIQITGIIKN